MALFNNRGPRPSYFKAFLELKRIPREVKVSIERAAGGQAFVHTGIPVRQSVGQQWNGSDDELMRLIMYWVEKRLAKDHLLSAQLAAFDMRWVGDILEVVAQYDVSEYTLSKWSSWFRERSDGNAKFVRDTIDPVYEEMVGGYYEDGSWDDTFKTTSTARSRPWSDRDDASGVTTTNNTFSNPRDAIATVLSAFALSTTEGLTDEKAAVMDRILGAVKTYSDTPTPWRDQAKKLEQRGTSEIQSAFSNAILHLANLADEGMKQHLVIFLFMLVRSEDDRSATANELLLINQMCSAFGVDPTTL